MAFPQCMQVRGLSWYAESCSTSTDTIPSAFSDTSANAIAAALEVVNAGIRRISLQPAFQNLRDLLIHRLWFASNRLLQSPEQYLVEGYHALLVGRWHLIRLVNDLNCTAYYLTVMAYMEIVDLGFIPDCLS
ncbi:MAG: hypothetical protein KA239_06095 [Bacteroidia bacterium]|nr:hypothetical protein [Bacteroidia bacterium]